MIEYFFSFLPIIKSVILVPKGATKAEVTKAQATPAQKYFVSKRAYQFEHFPDFFGRKSIVILILKSVTNAQDPPPSLKVD